MKKVPLLATASLTTLLAVAMSAPAYAWHPAGTIVKTVQNQTAGGAAADANDAASAVSAAPGDTLLYSITVSNNGAAASNGNNDMAGTTLTDTLPTGVQLVSDPANRTVYEDLGTIAPGQHVTKTYTVKVTDTTDGDVITNKACFEGNSTVGDSRQSGCDSAVIKVKVSTQPTTPPTPTPTTPTTPTTPDTPSTPSTSEVSATALPNTGSTGLTAALVVTAGVGLGYGLNLLRLRRSE